MKNWKRTLFIMVFVQFVVRVAIQLFVPFLPIFIASMGFEDIGTIALWTGAIAAINHLTAAIVSPIWGSFADKYGRKIMVLRSILSLSVFFFLMSYAKSVYYLFVMRMLMGLFSGYDAAIVSLIGSTTPEEHLGKSMSYLQAGQIAGTIIGPLVGGILSDLLTIVATLIIGSLLCIFAFLIVFFTIDEEFNTNKENAHESIFKSLKTIFEHPSIIPIFIALFVGRFSIKVIEPILTLIVQPLLESTSNTATYSGLVFAVAGVANIIGLVLIGNISYKINYFKLLTYSLALSGVFYILQGFAGNVFQLIVIRSFLGITSASIIPVANALIGRNIPKERRGTAYGVMSSATFLGSFAGPISGGVLTATLGIKSIFALTTIMIWLSGVYVYLSEKTETIKI